jgi:hypothetical protein
MEKLIDKDGNPVTKECIEEVFREAFKDSSPFIEKKEWEEEGTKYHAYKVNTGRGVMYTNDAGVQAINEAMKKELLSNADALFEQANEQFPKTLENLENGRTE